jgi:hypothetical protein
LAVADVGLVLLGLLFMVLDTWAFCLCRRLLPRRRLRLWHFLPGSGLAMFWRMWRDAPPGL